MQGTLYCMSLNRRGIRMRDARIYRGDHWDDAMIGRVSVEYLDQARFDKKVGLTILNGLSQFKERHLGKE